MKQDTAYKLAIEALERWKRLYIFDANLYRHGLKSISTERAHKQAKRIEDAIEIIENRQKVLL